MMCCKTSVCRIDTDEVFFTEALSALTGLATQSDVDEIYDVLKRVEAGVQHAADVWTTGTKSVLSAFQVQNIRLVLVNSIQGAQLLWGNGLTVFNAVAEIPVPLRQEIRIPFWRTTALRRLLKSRYFVMMHVLGTKNELLELILLRDFMVPELYMSTSMAEVSRPMGVYPSLTVA